MCGGAPWGASQARRRHCAGARRRCPTETLGRAAAQPGPSAPTRPLRGLRQGPPRAARVRSSLRSRASANARPRNAAAAPAARPTAPRRTHAAPRAPRGPVRTRIPLELVVWVRGLGARHSIHQRSVYRRAASAAVGSPWGLGPCRRRSPRGGVRSGRWPVRRGSPLRGRVGAGAGAQRRPDARSASRPLSEGPRRGTEFGADGRAERPRDQAFP